MVEVEYLPKIGESLTIKTGKQGRRGGLNSSVMLHDYTSKELGEYFNLVPIHYK